MCWAMRLFGRKRVRDYAPVRFSSSSAPSISRPHGEIRRVSYGQAGKTVISLPSTAIGFSAEPIVVGLYRKKKDILFLLVQQRTPQWTQYPPEG